MSLFWSKHPRARRALMATVAFVMAVAALALYLAYAYMPPEDRRDTPAYLTQIESQHLDHYIAAGAFRLHYLRAGSGEPVILLPGGGAWIYDFRTIITALEPHYTVYAIDPPGDGYTTPLANDPNYTQLYTLDAIDQSLLAFMNGLHIQKAAFIGNSWGGGYALYFTERHPERVTKYVSLDGAGLNLDDTGGQLTWQFAKWPVAGEIEMKIGDSRDWARQALQGLLIHQKPTDDMVNELYIPYTFHCNLISQWTLERNLNWRATERLIPGMRTPTLIIWGKQDNLLLPQLYIPRWRLLDPHATIIVVDQAGHLVHDDQPAEVNHLLLTFLAG